VSSSKKDFKTLRFDAFVTPESRRAQRAGQR
jgi:hypothetical protein